MKLFSGRDSTASFSQIRGNRYYRPTNLVAQGIFLKLREPVKKLINCDDEFPCLFPSVQVLKCV